MPDLVYRLAVAGDRDVENALKRLQGEAQNVAATIEPLNRQNLRLGDTSRTSMRAMGDFAQTLSGTASVLRIVGADNKALDASLAVVTTSLSLASVGTNLYKNALQLARGATLLLTSTTLTLSAILGPLTIALALVAAAVWLVQQHSEEGRRKFVEYEGALNTVAHAAREAARELDATFTKIARTPAELERSSAFTEAVSVGVRHWTQSIEEGWARQKAAAERAVAAAKQAAAKLIAETKRLRQEDLDLIRRFNEAAIQAIDEREREAIESGRRILDEDRQAKEESLDLIRRFNEAAIQAIDERTRAAIEAGRETLDEERRVKEEGLDLIRRANQEMIDVLEAQMDAQRRAALEIKPLWVQQAEAAKKAAQDIGEALHGAITNALMDVLETGKTIFETLANIASSVFNEIARWLISFGVRSFLRWLGVPLAKGGIVPGGLIPAFAGMQGGGIIHRPTLAMVGEGGQSEAVVPLPDNRSIPVKFEGGAARETVIHQRIVVVLDPSTIPRPDPDEIVSVVTLNARSGGDVYRVIREVSRR